MRLLRGGIPAILAFAAAIVFSILPTGPRAGVFLVGLSCLAATIAILDLIGAFDDAPSPGLAPAEASALLLPIGLTLVAGFAVFVSLRAAVAGLFGPVAAGITITASFSGFCLAIARAAKLLGVIDRRRSLFRHHGLWLLLIVACLYLPTLGASSLLDPWETHYGEVAREILSRDDWISLWWAQENWFWSKPILGFWLQAIAMAALGVRFEPGRMLSAVADGATPYPEWAVRFPIFVFSILAVYLLYKGVARAFGRTAGFFAGLVLATMPQWFLISRQTMTDLPFVAALTGAMVFAYLAFVTEPEDRVRTFGVAFGERTLRVSAAHVLFGLVLVVSLPQIVYLLTRNLGLRLDPVYGVLWPPVTFVKDSFMSGSEGNCGLPGNDACTQAFPTTTLFQPWLQGLVWLQALAVFFYLNWRERRTKRLLYLAAWLCMAISTMGKGPAGLVLPIASMLAVVAISGKLRELSRSEIPSGLLLFAAVCLPWFVAMYVRHGQPFVDRLIFHDIYKRAFDHVHDTNGGDDVSFRYYLWQLGYATFPFTALLPFALFRRPRDAERGNGPRGILVKLLALWAAIGFVLFAYMQTKFHHYVFPIVPAIAALVGIGLYRLTRSRGDGEPRALVVLAVAMALATVLVGRDMAVARVDQPSFARLLHLFTYNYEREWPEGLDFARAFWVTTLLAASAFAAMAVARARRLAVFGLLAVSTWFASFGLNYYFTRTAQHWGQRETALAYYRENAREPGPIISYQQNWKGENFYTGNRIPSFPSSGGPFRNYLDELKRHKMRTVYFFVSANRTSALEEEIGELESFEVLTTVDLNNKFVLVRARL